jgi:DNA-directed RNA polymerase sigma subunit (sigma70/sigma32)
MADCTEQNVLPQIDYIAFCGGNRELADRVIQTIAMVDGLADRYKGQGLSPLALTAHGCVGLANASDAFDSATDGDFVEHATPFVERSMQRAIDEQPSTRP